MWVATQDLPRSAAHPFYARLNQILDTARLRRVRRRAVRSGSTPDERPTGAAAGTLLPAAADRLLRGPGLRARDRVARGRFVCAARVSGLGVAGGAARSFDDLPDASLDRSRDARGRLHVDAAASGRRGPGQGEDDRHRRDDAGGERGAAQHRAARHGRELSGVPDEARAGVGHRDADARGPGAASIGSGRRRARTTTGRIRTIPTRRSRR